MAESEEGKSAPDLRDPDVLRAVLEQGDIDPDQVQRHVAIRRHKGPLPSPEDFREYDAVLPGCAERIVALWEGEAKHRREMERNDQRRLYAAFSRGQWFAFIIAMTAVILGAFLIYTDNDILGFTVLILGLSSAVAPFVRRLFSGGGSTEPSEEERRAEEPADEGPPG